MENEVTKILRFAIYSAYQDTRKDKVCRIFIPGDSRMFDRFDKVLKTYIDAVINSAWFRRYLQYQSSVQDIYGWIIKNKADKTKESKLLTTIVERAGEYAAACGEGARVRNNTLWDSAKNILTSLEEKIIEKFYQMVI